MCDVLPPPTSTPIIGGRKKIKNWPQPRKYISSMDLPRNFVKFHHWIFKKGHDFPNPNNVYLSCKCRCFNSCLILPTWISLSFSESSPLFERRVTSNMTSLYFTQRYLAKLEGSFANFYSNRLGIGSGAPSIAWCTNQLI